MPSKASIVTIAEPEYAPGKFVLLRLDHPHRDRWFVWCGRSMGWLPFKETSNAFFHRFPSTEAAEKAIKKALTLPLQEELPCSPS
ncbi:MAG: hypothetical protein NTW96_24610 [Planctomycetia bacterium]|nr:hypothetical protein [Planctomycetia bacterium]